MSIATTRRNGGLFKASEYVALARINRSFDAIGLQKWLIVYVKLQAERFAVERRRLWLLIAYAHSCRQDSNVLICCSTNVYGSKESDLVVAAPMSHSVAPCPE